MKAQVIVSLLAAVMLSACSGSGSVARQPVACAAFGPPDLGAKFVVPADNATGVSTTIGSVSFKVTDPRLFAASFTLEIQAVESSITVVSAPYVADASGTGTVAIPTLQPHTTYQGHVTGGCPVVGGFLGSFTTQ